MSQLYRVLYCSKNRLAGTPDTYPGEIQEILAAARRNNARDGLTGGLLFSDGCFAQALEGKLEMIQATFERIQCDERHHKVTVLQSGPIPARDFPDWSMAFAGTGAAGSAFAGSGLGEALAGASTAGDDVMRLLKHVIVREDDWIMPA